MKFVLWTIFWFGLFDLERYLDMWFIGGWDKYHQYYSSYDIVIAAGLEYFLWIFLYITIIKKED